MECDNEFESIVKVGTEFTYCDCGKLARRDHTPQDCEFSLLGPGWHRDGYSTKTEKHNINKKLIDSGRESEII
jgi:hypothetical protein